jgi:hypothetical protein
VGFQTLSPLTSHTTEAEFNCYFWTRFFVSHCTGTRIQRARIQLDIIKIISLN